MSVFHYASAALQVVVNSQAGKCFFPVDNRSGAAAGLFWVRETHGISPMASQGTGIAELREAIDREAMAMARDGVCVDPLGLVQGSKRA
jgi:hypothetical protein